MPCDRSRAVGTNEPGHSLLRTTSRWLVPKRSSLLVPYLRSVTIPAFPPDTAIDGHENAPSVRSGGLSAASTPSQPLQSCCWSSLLLRLPRHLFFASCHRSGTNKRTSQQPLRAACYCIGGGFTDASRIRSAWRDCGPLLPCAGLSGIGIAFDHRIAYRISHIASDWFGLDWIGLDWIGLDWIGLD
ncbi:unnamed protein product [Pseudo-nitzschia multistriata]|uniref:Uncharacterized protein n=1 Tax=Pseudo-nitzschia multistriata TaxID=183589 RepID=A0A448Z7V3_9STRA|nr:unnamed protein product [Pseudo-nitzschia multistriata]